METIYVEVKVNQEVGVDVDLGLVIDSINELPMTKRWNYFAQILNAVKLDSDLTEEQKRIIKRFLINKLEPLEALEV
jgi:hypothetical protein